MSLAWIYLSIAVVVEIAWATSLKWTDGYTRLWPSVINLVLVAINLVILAKAFRVLPTATAYAIWTGFGAAGVTAYAIIFQGEDWSLLKIGCIVLIILGIVGLRLLTPPA
jgi:quaternary ammonium compound-resistance protein SugE